MRSVKLYGKATLDKGTNRYNLTYDGIPVFKESVTEILGKGRDSFRFEMDMCEEQFNKSLSDLRYWKGPLLEIAFQCYRNLGFNLGSKEDAEYCLKSVFYYEEVEIYPLGIIQRQPKSLKYISEEDLIHLIDKSREFINTELGGQLLSKYDWAAGVDEDSGLNVDKETGEIR